MKPSIERLLDIREETLTRLQALEGSLWKEVQGQLHSQYSELPTWILVYEDSDLAPLHARFQQIVAPYLDEMGDYNFTVSYGMIEDESTFVHLDFLNDNKEIARGYSVGALGSYPQRSRRTTSIFRSVNSRREH